MGFPPSFLLACVGCTVLVPLLGWWGRHCTWSPPVAQYPQSAFWEDNAFTKYIFMHTVRDKRLCKVLHLSVRCPFTLVLSWEELCRSDTGCPVPIHYLHNCASCTLMAQYYLQNTVADLAICHLLPWAAGAAGALQICHQHKQSEAMHEQRPLHHHWYTGDKAQFTCSGPVLHWIGPSMS